MAMLFFSPDKNLERECVCVCDFSKHLIGHMIFLATGFQKEEEQGKTITEQNRFRHPVMSL